MKNANFFIVSYCRLEFHFAYSIFALFHDKMGEEELEHDIIISGNIE